MKVRHLYADCSFCYRDSLWRLQPALRDRWQRRFPRGWQLSAYRVQRDRAVPPVIQEKINAGKCRRFFVAQKGSLVH